MPEDNQYQQRVCSKWLSQNETEKQADGKDRCVSLHAAFFLLLSLAPLSVFLLCALVQHDLIVSYVFLPCKNREVAAIPADEVHDTASDVVLLQSHLK